MQSTRLALSLLVCAALAGCGDATLPNGEDTSQAASSAPGPWDTLAALPPEAQPYGLDVYTAKCVSCHGNLGQGVGKNPPVTGLTPTAMQQKLLDDRSGKIKAKQAAAKSQLSDAEIAAVSVYAGD